MDNIIVSFPNAGRTWLKKMTDDLGLNIYYSHQGSQHNKKLEFAQIDKYIKQYPDKFAQSKILLLHREIKDNLVSNYFQTIYRVGFKYEMSEFIRDSQHGIEKLIQFNLYWKNFSASQKIGLIYYNDIKKDTSSELHKLAAFFEYSLNKQKLDEVIDYCSFDNMKERETNWVGYEYYYKFTKRDIPDSFKVRRGVDGGYIDYMSSEDIDYCDEILNKYNYIELMKN